MRVRFIVDVARPMNVGRDDIRIGRHVGSRTGTERQWDGRPGRGRGYLKYGAVYIYNKDYVCTD